MGALTTQERAAGFAALVAKQSPAVLALKALWREYPAISANCTLAGKLAGIEAAKAGACPVSAAYVAQGYSLPDGMAWDELSERRARGDIPAHFVPVARTRGGVLGWGVPIVAGRYLLHPANVQGAL